MYRARRKPCVCDEVHKSRRGLHDLGADGDEPGADATNAALLLRLRQPDAPSCATADVRYLQMRCMIRNFLGGVVLCFLAATAMGGERIDVWVLLTEPPVVSGANNAEAIKRQQQAVLAQLAALGAVELARISRARNAVAVSIEPSKLAQVKKISGVRSVSQVRHIERDPPKSAPMH